eukprot:50145_1
MTSENRRAPTQRMPHPENSGSTIGLRHQNLMVGNPWPKVPTQLFRSQNMNNNSCAYVNTPGPQSQSESFGTQVYTQTSVNGRPNLTNKQLQNMAHAPARVNRRYSYVIANSQAIYDAAIRQGAIAGRGAAIARQNTPVETPSKNDFKSNNIVVPRALRLLLTKNAKGATSVTVVCPRKGCGGFYSIENEDKDEHFFKQCPKCKKDYYVDIRAMVDDPSSVTDNRGKQYQFLPEFVRQSAPPEVSPKFPKPVPRPKQRVQPHYPTPESSQQPTMQPIKIQFGATNPGTVNPLYSEPATNAVRANYAPTIPVTSHIMATGLNQSSTTNTHVSPQSVTNQATVGQYVATIASGHNMTTRTHANSTDAAKSMQNLRISTRVRSVGPPESIRICKRRKLQDSCESVMAENYKLWQLTVEANQLEREIQAVKYEASKLRSSKKVRFVFNR